MKKIGKIVPVDWALRAVQNNDEQTPLFYNDPPPDPPLGDVNLVRENRCIRNFDLCSAGISLICLGITVVIMIDMRVKGNQNLVPITQEIFFVTNNTQFANKLTSMYENYYRECNDITPLLTKPEYAEAGIVLNIPKMKFSLWGGAFWLYFWSTFFQFYRFLGFQKWYFPNKGPEFSRWLEYAFTSPVQIVLVSVSFGFGNIDSILGAAGMQCALVLFGYDIEQQIKKIYKKKKVPTTQINDQVASPVESQRFQHVLKRFGIRDLRLFVYLITAWGLHILIWGIPAKICKWGIGGKFYAQKNYLENCENNEKDLRVPEFVSWFYWSQFLLARFCFGRGVTRD